MTSRYRTDLTRLRLSRGRVLGCALTDELYAFGVDALHPEVDEAILDSKRAVDPERHKEKVKEAHYL